MNKDDEAKQLVAKLTLEEKAALLSGKDSWSTKPFDGIPSIFMTDGPHGLRKSVDGFIGVPATAFPTASALASSYVLTACVAPASRAIADFSSLRSMVTICSAPWIRAH